MSRATTTGIFKASENSISPKGVAAGGGVIILPWRAQNGSHRSFPVLPAIGSRRSCFYETPMLYVLAPWGLEWLPPQFPGRGLGETSIVVLLCRMRANVTLYLGVRSTSKTTGIGRASVAQWLECSTHDRKVPGSNPTADTRVFSSFSIRLLSFLFLVRLLKKMRQRRRGTASYSASAWYPRQTCDSFILATAFMVGTWYPRQTM